MICWISLWLLVMLVEIGLAYGKEDEALNE